MKYLYIILCFIIAGNSLGQKMHEVYDWEDSPKLSTLSESEAELSAVVIKDHHIIEYSILRKVYELVNDQYYTRHVVTKVNDDRGIERYNKVYIPMDAQAKVINIKVRTIDPDGNITALNESNIKELKNVDGYRNFKIFAIEGLVKGGDVEYIYTVKKPARSYGRELVQTDTKIKTTSITIAHNKEISIDAKSYNGFPELKENRERTKVILSATAYDIAGVIAEDYSAENANKMRVDYKVDQAYSGREINTWEHIATQIVNGIMDNKGKGKVLTMLKKLKIYGLPEYESVIAVESYIKDNFSIVKGNNEEYSDLKTIVSNKVSNDIGLIKLFTACWDVMEINPRIIMTSNRFNAKFDPDFSSFLNASELLFYFPKTKKYLAPTNLAYRLGPIPTDLGNNFGLQIKLNYYNEQFRTVNTQPRKFLDLLTYTENQLGTHANISLSESMDKVNISKINKYQGYRAIFMRSGYAQSTQEEKDEILKSLITSGITDAINIELTVENPELRHNYMNTPMLVNGTFETNSMIENAGTDYIISIGKAIGQQSELYQETERQFDVEHPHPMLYHHRIELDIPNGYECKNLNDLVIREEVMNDKGEKSAYFDSNYTIEGDKLIVSIEEAYINVNIPKQKYEDFRKVINAASNFSKVSILLSKKPVTP